jgi:hypothetical protein
LESREKRAGLGDEDEIDCQVARRFALNGGVGGVEIDCDADMKERRLASSYAGESKR